MKKILIIILFSFQFSVKAEDKKNDTLVFEDIKAHISRNCAKCVNSSDLKNAEKEIMQSIEQLKQLIASSKDDKALFEMKEFLADTYSMIAYAFYNYDDDMQKEYGKKMTLLYEEIYKEDRCLNPDLIINLYSTKKTNKERLEILQPILRLQSTLYKAKYYEGKILLKEGDIKKGLESLILAIHLADYVDAHYNHHDLIYYMKKYNRKDLAMIILKKTFPKIKDEKKLKKMLDGME